MADIAARAHDLSAWDMDTLSELSEAHSHPGEGKVA